MAVCSGKIVILTGSQGAGGIWMLDTGFYEAIDSAQRMRDNVSRFLMFFLLSLSC